LRPIEFDLIKSMEESVRHESCLGSPCQSDADTHAVSELRRLETSYTMESRRVGGLQAMKNDVVENCKLTMTKAV